MDGYDISGIIGLAPNNTLPSNEGPEGFVNQLNQYITALNEPVFSIYYSTDQIYNGMFIIGGKGYNVDKYALSGQTEDDIFWMDS